MSAAARGPRDGLARLVRDRPLLLELFAASNLAFLVLDIWLAHSVNEFHHPAEWIPFVYSAAGALLLFTVLAVPDADPFEGAGRWVGLAVGIVGVLVGVSGLVWHLESQFFQVRTLRSLVYSAPFVAPLAFTGVGFLLLLNRTVPHDAREWGGWVAFLAFGGFVGNFALSLVDHAQNGFFHWLEWIPVVTSALAVGYLLVAVLAPVRRDYLRLGWWIMGLQLLTGVAGFGLHAAPLFTEASGPLMDRVVYGPPLFAPLLFANLALLAGLGLWDMADKPLPEQSAGDATSLDRGMEMPNAEAG